MKIKDITNKGTTLYLLLKGLEDKITKTNKPYVMMTLADGENEIQAKMWDTTSATITVPVGSVINANVVSDSYGYVVTSYRPTIEGEVNIADFIPTSPVKPEVLYDEIMKIVKGIHDMEIRNLVEHIYNGNKKEIIHSSAAKMMHHNIVGGLLWHSYRMVLMAQKMTEIYQSVNADMVIAGCLLHDIGKLEELETDAFGNAEYTTDGKLFGHLYIGTRMVEEAGAKLGTNKETIRQLMHIIASHHGQQDMGAIAKPQTTEAFLVSEIDMLDSKIYQYEKAVASVEEGEFSEKLYGLGNIQVYHPKEV